MKKVKIYAFADEAGVSLQEQLSALTENSLDGIELRNIDGENVSDITQRKARELRIWFDSVGLRVWSAGSPIGKISITDDFSAHLDKFRRTLDNAAVLGAECIRIFSFYIPGGRDPAEYQNEVTDRLGEFARLSKGYNISLCHENEKGIYGDTAQRCLNIHRALPEVKAVFDPANFIQCGEDTLTAFDLLKSYVKYMHIKDALDDGSVVPAGKGIGNIKKIAEDFLSIGGNSFTVEPHLTVFEGFDSLEKGTVRSTVGKYIYKNRREAFDTACTEFKKIISEVCGL